MLQTQQSTQSETLQQLIAFRKSLSVLRKHSHGNLIVSDVNLKAIEFTKLVAQANEVTNSNSDGSAPSQQVSKKIKVEIDHIWTDLFSAWNALSSINPLLYHTYTTLVILARTSDIMREDGAWTQEDISALQNAVRPIDEQFSADGGKFLVHDNLSVSSRWRDANGGVEVLNGQAALSSLLARVHANISVMNEDGEDLDVELAQLKKELEGSFATLERLEKRVGGYTIADLFGISKRLHDLDSCRGTTGKFPHSNAKTGHATVAGILNSCFDKLVALVAALDPVPADSPLQKINQSLIQIHVDLQAIAFASTKPNQDQEQLISLLDSAQERLESLEVKFRFNGTFVPDGNECSFPLSVRLAGQTTLHKMLHDCHALITRLIDPFAAPVGEALFSTYEILLKERAILRRLRRWSSAGWDVSESVTQVEFTLKNIEEHRVKGFFVGKALNSYSGSGVKVATEGQVAVSALFDECDSLIWQINLTSQ